MSTARTNQDDPALRPITDFDGARDFARPADRLAGVRRQARAFREKMLAGKPVLYYRSFDLIRVPYPNEPR